MDEEDDQAVGEVQSCVFQKRYVNVACHTLSNLSWDLSMWYYSSRPFEGRFRGFRNELSPLRKSLFLSEQNEVWTARTSIFTLSEILGVCKPPTAPYSPNQHQHSPSNPIACWHQNLLPDSSDFFHVLMRKSFWRCYSSFLTSLKNYCVCVLKNCCVDVLKNCGRSCYSSFLKIFSMCWKSCVNLINQKHLRSNYRILSILYSG